MRRFSNIDNGFCINNKLNLPQAYVYEWMINLNKWANTIMLESRVFYFASKTKAVEDLSILTTKTNTMHTHYKALESKGLIIVKKIDGKDYIHLTSVSQYWNSSKHFDKNQSNIGEKSKLDFDKNQTYSNTNTVNSNTNKRGIIPISTNDLFEGQKIESLPIQILKFLNEKKPGDRPFQFTPSNISLIETRIKEGFKLEDFKKVISFKVNEWKNDDKMKKYIRPATLFGSKFDQYVVESSNGSSSSDGSQNFQYKPQKTADLL